MKPRGTSPSDMVSWLLAVARGVRLAWLPGVGWAVLGRARRGVRDCRAHEDEEEEVRETWGKRERESICVSTL